MESEILSVFGENNIKEENNIKKTFIKKDSQKNHGLLSQYHLARAPPSLNGKCFSGPKYKIVLSS